MAIVYRVSDLIFNDWFYGSRMKYRLAVKIEKAAPRLAQFIKGL